MRPDERESKTTGRALLMAAGIASLFAMRAAWLLLFAAEPSTPAAIRPDSHLVAVREKPAAQPTKRLSVEDYTAIAGLCPTAVDELPAEMLPEGVQPTRARLTDVRVASRDERLPSLIDPAARVAQSPPATDEGWLVPPEQWFVPEDQTPTDPPPATPPGPAAPTDPAKAPETTPPKIPLTPREPVAPLDPPASPAEPTAPEPIVPADPRPDWRRLIDEANSALGTEAPQATEPEPVIEPEDAWPSQPLKFPGDATPPAAEAEPSVEVEEWPSTPLGDPAETFPSAEDADLPAQQPEWPSEPLKGPAESFPPVVDPAAPELIDEWPSEPLSDPAETSPPADGVDPSAPAFEAPSFEAPANDLPAAEPDFAPQGVATPPDGLAPESSAPSLAPPLPVEPTPDNPPGAPGWDGPYDRVAPPAAEFGADLDPLNLDAQSPADPADESATPESLPVPAEVDPVEANPVELAPSDPPPAIAEPVPPPATPTNPEPAEVVPSEEPAAEAKPLFAAPSTAEPPLIEPQQAGAPITGLSPHQALGPEAAAEAREAAGGKSADESHAELFARNNYPSALECAKCHQRAYDEWSVSSHAYAFVSPMYHRFEEKITQLSQGTVGHFCQRCHSPVGTAMGYPRSTPFGEMVTAAKEGVTCIACHRVNQRWGRSNGDRRIEPGDITAPIYGGVGGEGVARAIANKATYKVKTSPHEKGPGQPIHREGRFFDQLTQSEACTSCHQVAVHPGVKLEVVWEQYRASPACKKGVTCQECHMGRVPGMAGGFDYGPVAEVAGKTVSEHRKVHNHVFYGPGYSIAHPGIFPQNKDALAWSTDEWTRFDWRAGWGTDAFEERMEQLEDAGHDTSVWFPPEWANPDDRADAREIVEDNLERLKKKRRYRELVMENGSKVDGPFFRKPPVAGRDLQFDYVVANLNEGHNLPTASLGAQPQLWANVVLIGPKGRRLWESGYTDSNGDLCDIHSVDVRHGRLPFDKQLFNLQTMFLITGATGTDREFYLPVNLDIDQVAQLRPGVTPITTQNHPPFIRMEGRSLAPLGKKRVKYTVPADLMRQRGRYRLTFRLRSRTEPMYFMRLCEATPEMLRAMTEGTLDIHPQSVEFEVR